MFAVCLLVYVEGVGVMCVSRCSVVVRACTCSVVMCASTCFVFVSAGEFVRALMSVILHCRSCRSSSSLSCSLLIISSNSFEEASMNFWPQSSSTNYNWSIFLFLVLAIKITTIVCLN